MSIEIQRRINQGILDLGREVNRTYEQPTTFGPAQLAQTTTVATYPTTPFAYYAVIPQLLAGAEVEGGSGSIVALTGSIFALNLGSTVPPTGTYVLITFVGNRWVFRYDG